MKTRTDSRRGAILGVVMVVMVLVGLAGAGLLNLTFRDTLEAVSQIQSRQAFWLAEAGLEQARVRMNDQSFRDNLPILTETLGFKQTYEVAIVQIGEEKKDFDTVVYYTAKALGTSGQNVRKLTRNLSVTTKTTPPEKHDYPSMFDYAVFNWSGPTVLNNKSVVNGNTNSGQAVFSEAPPTGGGVGGINGEVHIKDADSPVPELDTEFYDNYLSQVSGNATPPAGSINLGTSVVYINGDITLNELTGPGFLVVSGKITINSKGTIGDDVTLIAGTSIEIKNGAYIGDNAILFANHDIEIKNNVAGLMKTALITPGDVIDHNGITMTGIIFAGGKVEHKNSASITGSVVALGGIEQKAKVTVTHDRNAFPPTVPPGIGESGQEPEEEDESAASVIAVLKWDEE